MSLGKLGTNIGIILSGQSATPEPEEAPVGRARSGDVTEQDAPAITRYNKAYKVFEPRLKAAKEVTPVPPPVAEKRTGITTAEGILTPLVTAKDYDNAIPALTKLDDATKAFEAGLAQWKLDKAAYETNYTGLATRVSNLPAANTLTRIMKAAHAAVMTEETKRADAVKPDVQDYAKAKDIALELKKKLDFFDKAKENQEKLKGDLEKVFTTSPLNQDKVKEIAAKPGGDGALDALVGGLDPATTPTATFTAAVQARFGVTVTEIKGVDTTQEANTDWKRIYSLMTIVPESHVKNSPSLKQIQRTGGASGSSYYSGGKDDTSGIALVAMQCGRPGSLTDDAYQKRRLTTDSGLPARDPGCELQNTDNCSFFDWTTLHEVGHAVDDQKSYMTTNGATLAGWKKLTAAQVAAAAGPHLHFPASYIQAYLEQGAGSNPPAATKPDNKTQEEWNTLRDAAREWCDAIRAGKNLWYNQGECAARKIGDLVYHEPYAGRGYYHCYSFAARSKGLKGYQFRAPGEWFAELYAAYHIDPKVIKESHPGYAIIRDLT